MKNLKITDNPNPKAKYTDEGALGFGMLFTDHMYICDYNEGQGWHDARIEPYHSFTMDPASLVFHYGQAIFEGMKAYRNKDGQVRVFRAKDNLERMNRSAKRLCIPEMDADFQLEALYELIRHESEWIPTSPGTALYIRPTIIAADPVLGVKTSDHYLYYVILSPVGAYYKEGLKPIRIYVEDEYVRAVRGGMGFAKTSGNYAASLIAGEVAAKKGFSQVLWLDGVTRRHVEEVGSMNMFFVMGEELVTPQLNGSILPGITRDSIIRLAGDMGVKVTERVVEIDEVFEAAKTGALKEAFGTGTAAVVSPVGFLAYGDKSVEIAGGQMGELSQKLYDRLTGIQTGLIEDPYGWVTVIK